MLFVVDIGNTNITIGGVREGDVLFTGRIRTQEKDPLAAVRRILKDHHAAPEDFSGAALSSVVPDAARRMRDVVRALGIADLLIVDCHTDCGITLRVDRPESVGTDMIVGAAECVYRYGAPVILIDMGTATTFSVVNEHREYLGHMIIPGIGISLEALYQKAAQLPEITPELPPHLIGTNTVDAMRSGILYGNAAMTDGLIDRIFEDRAHRDNETAAAMKVVATGGLAGIVIPLCRHEIVLDDTLLLTGLYHIYRRNRSEELQLHR